MKSPSLVIFRHRRTTNESERAQKNKKKHGRRCQTHVTHTHKQKCNYSSKRVRVEWCTGQEWSKKEPFVSLNFFLQPLRAKKKVGQERPTIKNSGENVLLTLPTPFLGQFFFCAISAFYCVGLWQAKRGNIKAKFYNSRSDAQKKKHKTEYCRSNKTIYTILHT